MLLRLQHYNLAVRYKKGPVTFIMDTLSRAYLRETLPSEEVKSSELVDHTEKHTCIMGVLGLGLFPKPPLYMCVIPPALTLSAPKSTLPAAVESSPRLIFQLNKPPALV